jgi:hypothetical protein
MNIYHFFKRPFLFGLATVGTALVSPEFVKPKVIGYFDAHTQGHLTAKDAQVGNLTHLVISNAFKVDNEGQLHLWVPNASQSAELSTEELAKYFSNGTKPAVVLSLRGYPDDTALDELAEVEETRQAFVKAVATKLQDWGASGLEIEWHADDVSGGKQQNAPFDVEEQDHILLLSQDLASALRPLGKTLSMAVRPGRHEFTSSVDVRKFIDWLSVRAYSMRSLGDPHHSSLKDAVAALDEWRDRGVGPEQLVLITPLFARPGAALRAHSRDATLRRPWHDVVNGELFQASGPTGDVFLDSHSQKKWWASGFNTTRAKAQHVVDQGYHGLGFQFLHHDAKEDSSLLEFSVRTLEELVAEARRAAVPLPQDIMLFQNGWRRSQRAQEM